LQFTFILADEFELPTQNEPTAKRFRIYYPSNAITWTADGLRQHAGSRMGLDGPMRRCLQQLDHLFVTGLIEIPIVQPDRVEGNRTGKADNLIGELESSAIASAGPRAPPPRHGRRQIVTAP